MATGADSTDLALLSALSVLTCDRGVPLKPHEAKAVYQAQESIGEILHKKCRFEGKPKKFTALVGVLSQLRSTVKQVDLDKMRQYKAKIMMNPRVPAKEVIPERPASQASSFIDVENTVDIETVSDSYSLSTVSQSNDSTPR